MRARIIRGLAVLALAGGAGMAAAAPAMAAPAGCTPGSTTCAGGQTNLTATVNDVFTVTGFPTAVSFAPVAPGATTAGAASVYSVETNHASGYNVTVAIDPGDTPTLDGYPSGGACPSQPNAQADIMRDTAGNGCNFIPLADPTTGSFITVQHATSGGTLLGPVQSLPVSSAAPVTIVTTSGPEGGSTQYADLFTLQIPGGTQASGSYSAVLDYVLSENA